MYSGKIALGGVALCILRMCDTTDRQIDRLKISEAKAKLLILTVIVRCIWFFISESRVGFISAITGYVTEKFYF